MVKCDRVKMTVLYERPPPPLYSKSLQGKEEVILNATGLFVCPGNTFWDINTIRRTDVESLQCVCVCCCIYPICIRHEETFRHPWASRRIVVYQVGVSSLKDKEMVIQD